MNALQKDLEYFKYIEKIEIVILLFMIKDPKLNLEL